MAVQIVDITVHLEGGHSFQTRLPSDSTVLRELHEVLMWDEAAPRLMQVPVQNGTQAYSFSCARLVAVETNPPVLIDTEIEEGVDVVLAPSASSKPVSSEMSADTLATGSRRSPPVVRDTSGTEPVS